MTDTDTPSWLSGIDCWSDPLGGRAAVIRACIEAEFEGLAITAPARVGLDNRDGLPVVGCWAATLRDAKAMPFDQTVVATAVCLETGRAYVDLAVAPLEEPVSEPASDREPGEGCTYEMFVTPLRSRLALPWKPGTFLITYLQRDRRSNRVRVELGQSTSYDDLEVQKLREELLRKQPAPAIEGPAAFERRDDLPAPPEQPGIALAAERVVVTEEGAPALLLGSFRLPLPPHQVLSAERRGELAGSAHEGATGVVPLTVVISGSDRPGPVVVHLGVPTFDPLQPGGDGGEATGQFALDLLKLPEIARMPSQTYFIHALAGEAVSDPATMALVSPALLP